MSEHTSFLEIFPGAASHASSCGGLEKAYVTDVEISLEAGTMSIRAHFIKTPAPAELDAICSALRADYGLSVSIIADSPEIKKAASVSAASAAPSGGNGKVLMGHSIKKTPTPMGELNQDSGRVAIEGDVFEITSRKLKKRDGAMLSFDITDLTGSIRVIKFLRAEDDQSIINKINVGDHLIINGFVTYSRYDEDIVLEPKDITVGKKYIRPDNAEEKRVELHVHTRFSALDALTDPAAIVKRAAYWGHPAIAVTDHGVLQAFPDMWKAGKKHGVKIIYGCECYFVNDMDGSLAVHGSSDRDMNDEMVAFDIETTGLNAGSDRMTEIGAVIYAGNEIKETFNTFVDPGMHIPAEITQLTGITDRDVKGAPSEAEAMRSFLEFVGDRPIVAHNADFDTGFMSAAAARSGIEFEPVYLDTLALSHALLPDLKRHKLDIVSNRLSLPEFNHHRASDDALVVARIMGRFLPMLAQQGAKTVNDIQEVYARIKPADHTKSRHMILLVKNKTGLKNLYELVSQSYLKYFYKTPTMPKSLLIKHREGLLIGSACGMGELYGAVMHGASDSELRRIASFYDYLEIQPLGNNGFLVDNGVVSDITVLQDYNRRILEIGRQLGKPVIAASDVHFLDAEDEQYRKILQAAKKFSDADRGCPIFFRTTDEMLKEFDYLGDETAREVVIKNPRAIADMVDDIELLPKDLYPPKIENSARDLRDLVYGKMTEIYGENPPEIVKSRVDTELTTILDHNYDVIYMSAQKLVQNSLEHGYLVGSRGSVGSSIVAYMSGITEVNSLPPHYVCPKCKHSEFITDGSYGCGADMPPKNCPECGTLMRQDGFDIPFETFLGFPGNEKTPDIDLNFSGEYQAQAHKYTEELFGSDHVFRAGTIGTLAEKTAYGYVKKYLEERGIKVTKVEENRLAKGLVGVKRTTGQHPGGLVVIPQDMDVTDFCPVQHPADDATGGIITTHFEYHSMEANLLKLDELGHDDPTMIRMLEDATGVNAREIPLDDPETMRIFTSPEPLGIADGDPIIGHTGTIGVPEFGTAFTRQMLVDTQPHEFATLVRLSGFSHGTDVWAGNIHDIVVNGIAPTDKCVGCRDDIMLYLIDMGMEPKRAFKFMEAVRKGAIHKGKPWPDGIVEEMQQLGVPEWWIESCRKIQYLFPKAHAVAYVTMAFRIAWFKVHEPLAYYSAYFYRRSQKDGFDAESMLQGIDKCLAKINAIRRNPNATAKEEDLLTTLEAVYEFYRRGFTFAPIDIYKSDSYKFLIEDGCLRPPFVAISGLGGSAAEDLKRAQDSGAQFVSIDDISDACPKVSAAHLDMLRKLGALGDLPESRQVSLFDAFGEM